MGGKDKKGQRTKGNVKVSGNSLIFGRHLFTLNFGRILRVMFGLWFGGFTKSS